MDGDVLVAETVAVVLREQSGPRLGLMSGDGENTEERRMRKIGWKVLAIGLAVPVLVVTGSRLRPLAQDAAPGATPETVPPMVQVALNDLNDQAVGVASFTQQADGTVAINVTVDGVTTGSHGIHLHAVGDCTAVGESAFSTAGGHVNPDNVAHGAAPFPPESDGTPTAATPITGPGHAGDLGNIIADENGAGRLRIVTDRVTLAEGERSLRDGDGSALIIHANLDDLTTDPTGNSGGRVICGVVFASTVPIATPGSATPPA